MIRPAGSIRRAEPLRYDALANERTSVLKDNRAIPLIMPVEGNTIADATKEIGERALALFERLSARIHLILQDMMLHILDRRWA
jgi:hypothetical protein